MHNMIFMTLIFAAVFVLGVIAGRLTAPSRAEQVAERLLVPGVEAVADRIDAKNQCLADVTRLEQANRVCAEQLGVQQETVRRVERQAQKRKEQHDAPRPREPYKTPEAQVWADQPVPPEIALRIADALEPVRVPAHTDRGDRTHACSRPAERVERSDSDARSVHESSSCRAESGYSPSSSSDYSSSSSDCGSSSDSGGCVGGGD